MEDQVSKDETVEAVDTCGVEGTVCETTCCIDCGHGFQVLVTTDDKLEGSVVVLVLRQNTAVINPDIDSGVQFLEAF